MKLLHTEVDVVPGRKPQKQPLPEGYVGAGTAVLRITNTTSRQNAYTVRLRCEEPYWQDAWYQLAALPPTGGPENQPPPGKPDQLGPRNQTLTIYVKDGGSRDIFISYFVPEKSECRAGAYPVKIVVETRILSDDPQIARQERISELPSTVIVRPFYKWAVSYTPEERKVGFFRRGKEFELVVDNQGNDWLYCDLKMPRPQNVLIETPTVRLSVPPPEPGADSIRTVPFKGISRVKTIRGMTQSLPLPITVQRVDAPTVPPLPEDAMIGPSGANVKAAVIHSETPDVGAADVQPALIYHPLIPATFVDFGKAIVNNLRGIVIMLIGLIIAWNMAVFCYEYFMRSITEFHVMSTQAEIGKPLYMRGRNLLGAKILIFDETGKNQIGEPLEPKYGTESVTSDKIGIVLTDKTLEHKRIRIGAQRYGKLTFLSGFLPIEKDPSVVQVGKETVAKGVAAGSISSTVPPGQPLSIGGANFGDEKGKVLLNGSPAVISGWTDSKITVKIPQALQNGEPVTILVFDPSNNPISVAPNQFVVMSAIPPTDAGSTGGEIPPDTTGGGMPPDTSGGTGGGDPTTSGGGTSGGAPGTSGGTSGGSTGGGNPDGGAMVTPKGYASLLPDTRAGYVKAVSAASGPTAGQLAVKAYALASIGKVDDAKAALLQANQKLGNKTQGADVALVYIALARVTEKLNPANGDAAYANADEKANAAAPGFAFTDIAIARYKISQGKWGEANALLSGASQGNLSAAERAAVTRMMQQVQSRSQ